MNLATAPAMRPGPLPLKRLKHGPGGAETALQHAACRLETSGVPGIAHLRGGARWDVARITLRCW
jgi:hypothetical protein